MIITFVLNQTVKTFVNRALFLAKDLTNIWFMFEKSFDDKPRSHKTLEKVPIVWLPNNSAIWDFFT